MNRGLIVTLVIAVALLLFGGGCFASYINTRQTYVGYETDIAAQDRELQNVDTEITNNLQTQGLTAVEYKKTVIDAFQAANSGRYGAGGSKAMMQWIKEQNPNIDPGIFKKIMITADAGYAKFSGAQRRKIDIARVYRKTLEQKQLVPIWGPMVTAGFPRKPWAEMERVIVSSETAETWKTGVQKAKQPFPVKE